MGRSKFPGKPSKHVNRTRINVLPPLTNSQTVGEIKLVTNCENKPEEKQKEITVNADNENKPTSSHTNTTVKNDSVSSKNKNVTGKQRCLNVQNSINKSRLCRENMNIKRNRRSVQSLKGLRRLSRTTNSIKENGNLVGKFVLPSRSVHSSRVIKPNKRFINVESVNRIEVRSMKKRAGNRRVNTKEKEERNIKSNINESDNELRSNPNSSGNRRVILRQARLQVNSYSCSYSSAPSGSEGPFSSNSSSGSPPGTITCGVCGAVRFYRFIRQARKFNIYSCESCRKFISKIIKRQTTCNKNSTISTLVCHKGQGKCHVPPIVRSQQWNLIHCAYRARCPACWLKMCLRSFQMPQNLKNNLYKLLPANMRRPDTSLFNDSVMLFSWQNNNSKSLDSEVPPNTVKQRTRRIKQLKSVVSNTTNINTTTSSITPTEVKRQKIDLKGPRVKHVCRSASIVLGQPIATFQSDHHQKSQSQNENEYTPTCKTAQLDVHLQTPNKHATDTVTSKESCSYEYERSNEEEEDVDDGKSTRVSEQSSMKNMKISTVASSNGKKEKNKMTITNQQSSSNFESKVLQLGKKNVSDYSNNGISIDFWENYDPEEVCRNGFNLIASEPFPMQSICFLCGSAGREPLLYCSLCCEPYHSFCLEQDPQLLGGSIQYNWLCPRCTTCAACGQPDKQKVNCQKCHKAYHPECFNSKWITNDKPTVCLTCLRCKSCGTNNITKFVGNLPLCVMCFKLRKKGNFCPLCQKCYDDNDFDTKMMECAKCNKWIHARCEGLSDEYYQILSLLPESVEFLCKICSINSTPYWRKAIESELKTSFNNVLRLLSKNRIARDMLKWSPLCNNIFTSRTASAARKLQFSDDEDEHVEFDDLNDKPEKSMYLSESGSLIDEKSPKETELHFPLADQLNNRAPPTPSMTDIKNKLNSNEINSISEFNKKMSEVLSAANSEKLDEIYKSILAAIFPWYDPNLFNSENEDSCTLVHEESVLETPKIENNIPLLVNEKLNVKPHLDIERFDSRLCALCKGVGDGLSHQEARLLYCGQNEWVHANCALWSSEVYEEIDGSLQNVHSALSRGRLIRCTYCKLKGASVGCCAKGCYETFHFSCARAIKCNFMHDKTVYCPSHELPPDSSVISSLADFDIRRSIYVELDKKKKKLVNPEKVHTIVGSLSITNLGKITPILSDTPDALIPTGFVCSRLFWSTVEPWKLVPYVIKTSVLNSQVNNIVVDKNFTVNHSLPKTVVDKKIKEILLWQKELEKEKIDAVDLEDEDEPQHATEILSPELTDAILEELPRDLLDGISMQDIFPKFMSYEELLNVDFKNPETQNSNDDPKKDSESEEKKQNEELNLKNKELKRSKSEIFPQLGIEKVSKSRSQQRSCSLTWSCKLDTSLSPLVKKRKISPRDKNVFFQLLQVDGAYDSSSGSECSSPRRENEYLWSPNHCDEPVKCERCQCTYRTQASYKRHLESCEIMSTSDSDSEHDYNTAASITDNVNVNNNEEETNNSFSDYTVYQVEESEMKSSVANHAEMILTNAVQEKSAGNSFNVPSQDFTQMSSLPQLPVAVTQSSNSFFNGQQSVAINTHKTSNSIPLNEIAPICINQHNSVPLCLNQRTNTAGSISVVQSSPLAVNPQISLNQQNVISIGEQSVNSNPIQINTPIEMQSQQVTIHQSVPINQEMNQVLNIAPTVLNPGIVTNQWVKAIPKPISKPIKSKCRPRVLAVKRSRIPSAGTIVLPQPQTNAGTQVLVQHIPSPNVMPTFLESFQQQTGQNLQYITTISPQITPTVNSQPQIVQLQSDNNIVGLMQQPTMVIQQPRVITDQLIIDQNGSVMWASQPIQPVYYGFETIVQNTVMQSQQFLPTTVPGILTANSSYSSTTQVFQTSKLEPILDVTPGSYVVLNQPVAQISQSSISQQNNNNNNNNIETQLISIRSPETKTNVAKSVEASLKSITPIIGQNCSVATTITTTSITTTTNTHSNNSITLPVAPFVPEQRIPTNIVIPTPKVPPSIQNRPMSRVLPMQTTTVREIRRPPSLEKYHEDASNTTEELIKTRKCEIIEEDLIKPKTKEIKIQTMDILDNTDKPGDGVLQPQQKKSTCDSSCQKNYSVQIISLKSIKPKTTQPLSMPTLPISISTNKLNNSFAENTFTSGKDLNEQTLSTNNNSIKPILKSEAKIEVDKVESNPNPDILYTVETRDGFKYSSNSVSDLWSKVFEAVQAARVSHNMAPLPANGLNLINNLQLLGLKANSLRYLLEQLPGASKCVKYKPNFNFNTFHGTIDDDLLIGQPYGSVRCAPYNKRIESNDMFGWLSSRHRKLEDHTTLNEIQTRRSSITNLPMAMRFRQLRLSSKTSVGVYRSGIHRRGLFCLRDIESGEMVIEYAGEVIRSVLTDKREKFYNSKGIGCYMFRIDDNLVVDATMKGNSARFINHSCDPNCYSKVVEILGHKHIIIFALRKIASGEELTYDYKFPFEEDKIPCTCGSRKCRKFLN